MSEDSSEDVVDLVEVWKSTKDGQWYFRGKSDNGKIIFASEGYVRRVDAIRVADEIARRLSVSFIYQD